MLKLDKFVIIFAIFKQTCKALAWVKKLLKWPQGIYLNNEKFHLKKMELDFWKLFKNTINGLVTATKQQINEISKQINAGNLDKKATEKLKNYLE